MLRHDCFGSKVSGISVTVRIQSIARAAGLLDAMLDGGWHTLGTLARANGLAKTTAFNLVTALVQTGLAEHDPALGAYRLGLRHVEFGRAVERRLDLLETLRPTLMRLCAESNETVNLAVPRPVDLLIIESLEGRQTVRVTSYAGTRAAYHCTAAGRAMLAHKPPDERRALLGMGLDKPTPNTVVAPASLELLLQAVREHGYATEREENEIGACCVAAPLLSERGQVMGAVSIAGPTARMGPAVLDRLGQLLLERLAHPGLAAR